MKISLFLDEIENDSRSQGSARRDVREKPSETKTSDDGKILIFKGRRRTSTSRTGTGTGTRSSEYDNFRSRDLWTMVLDSKMTFNRNLFIFISKSKYVTALSQFSLENSHFHYQNPVDTFYEITCISHRCNF